MQIAIQARLQELILSLEEVEAKLVNLMHRQEFHLREIMLGLGKAKPHRAAFKKELATYCRKSITSSYIPVILTHHLKPMNTLTQ